MPATVQLRYLLCAATAWNDTFFKDPVVTDALATNGVPEEDRDWDCLTHCFAAARSEDATTSAPGNLLMTRYQHHTFSVLPANWPGIFSAVRPS
ncbi:hypothetical protein [Actinoplanes friuliensis]|uniref:hypothetical protein n=1 Tax=Actinoplanes friuliensis TaxID=196914 RepID=UPI0004108D6F|nr:hypothetical protein [Actinoplanes friuliensis]